MRLHERYIDVSLYGLILISFNTKEKNQKFQIRNSKQRIEYKQFSVCVIVAMTTVLGCTIRIFTDIITKRVCMSLS